jgi:tRNA-splicing ligase RtcB
MSEAPIRMWLSGALPEGVEGTLARLRRTEGVVQIAVMPDVHLASEFCVGTVVASEGVVFPQAVGGDIGCGMLAQAFDVEAEALADERLAARVIGQLSVMCPGRRHHRRLGFVLPESLRAMTLSDPRLEGVMRGEELRLELGTLGAGNHFLELQADAAGRLWMMIHTGSRNLGQQVLHHHLPRARRLESGVLALDTGTSEGAAYVNDVAVARAWARENRRCLAEAAERVLAHVVGARAASAAVDCDHNHVQLERVGEREVWVHRKGATAAQAGAAGIVPGSMGTRSFHTVGKGEAAALNSSSHGAGRALSRTQARDRVTVSALRQQLRGVWYDARLERALREEAPAAYKDIEAVMAAQEGLTKVTRWLRPVLIHKGV